MEISTKLRYIMEGYNMGEISSGNVPELVMPEPVTLESLMYESTTTDNILFEAWSGTYLTESDDNKFIEGIKKFFKWIGDKIRLFVNFIRSKFSKNVKDTKVRIQDVEKKLAQPEGMKKSEFKGVKADEIHAQTEKKLTAMTDAVAANLDKLKDQMKELKDKENAEYEAKLKQLKEEQEKLAQLEKEKKEAAAEAKRKKREEDDAKFTKQQARTIRIPLTFAKMETMEVYINKVKTIQDKVLHNVVRKQDAFDGIEGLNKLDKSDEDFNENVKFALEQFISGENRKDDIGKKLSGVVGSLATFEKEEDGDKWKRLNGSQELTTQEILNGLKHLTDVVEKNRQLLDGLSNDALNGLKDSEKAVVEAGMMDRKSYRALSVITKEINDFIAYFISLNGVFLRSVNNTLDTLEKL
jgi:hypothetical protein